MTETSPAPCVVLSGWTIRRLADALPGPIEVSLDLGRTRRDVVIESESVLFPDGLRVARRTLTDVCKAPEDCVEITPAGCRKIYRYDEGTGKYYKLFQPVEDRPPTLVIGGATMHAIVDMDPWEDEAEKVAAIGPGRGDCLDTCFGLGYSAQMLGGAGFARVISCEVDAAVMACAAANPWSQPALTHPRIEIVRADVRDYVARCDDGRFTAVFHDPPTIHQAGDLYSGDLYAEFHRVLSPRGVLYHYVGLPGARHGQDYARGVIRRLQEAGFSRVQRRVRGAVARRMQ